MTERPKFNKQVILGSKPGTVVIREEGEKDIIIKDPKRKPKIPSELLGNLKSLAIITEGISWGVTEHDFYNQEIEKLRIKYPNEQPEEVWSRTLATLINKGVQVGDIAGALLDTNLQYNIDKKIGGISDQVRAEKLQILTDKIIEYWPKPKR